jgi:hypothetical protein
VGSTRSTRRLTRPTAVAVGTVAVLLGISGCSQDTELGRLGYPAPITDTGPTSLQFWQGTWIAAFGVGIVTWGLILWAVVAYRRRTNEGAPIQTRYNLPIEIMYTIVPTIMIAALFAFSARDQSELTKVNLNNPNTVGVIGFKWNWDRLDRPQGDRQPVLHHLVRVLPVGGVMALLIRAELARPGLQFVTPEQYNQLFTMHGTIMLLLFATPLFAGFANAIMPLQIGAPDVAFPRLNMLAYWLYLFGGLIAQAGFLTPGAPRRSAGSPTRRCRTRSTRPASAATCGSFGLALGGFGTILGAVNFITTIICMRAPGMTMFRMPIFTWNILVTSVLC